MPRGDKPRGASSDKERAEKTQGRLQAAGLSRRTAEDRAWDEVNRKGRGTKSAGTSGGRSKVSKRTTRPAGSTSKSKSTGKTRK
jgi:hypothetical protein